jgi:hypothetical protein
VVQVVDIGFVCSVCLSIFSEEAAVQGVGVGAAVRRPLRPFRRPLRLRFTYVTSVLVKKC